MMPNTTCSDLPSFLSQDMRKNAVLLSVYLVPGAKREEIVGVVENSDGKKSLKVKIRAIAEGGKANESLRKFVAGFLKIAPSRCQLVRGHTSRHKILEIDAPISELIVLFREF